MSKLNTPWSLDADAVRDNTGRIVVETINCGETFAEEIVKCVNGYADLEADLENCVLAKRQAENAVARFTAEGGNLRKRISELEAERDALKAELDAERMRSNAWKEAYRIECESKRYTVPFEEYAADMQKAYEEGRYDEQHTDYGTSLYEQPAWEGSETKQHIDERRRANAAPVTLRNAGPGKPLHDEDPTL